MREREKKRKITEIFIDFIENFVIKIRKLSYHKY